MTEKMRLTRSRLATSSPGSEDIILLDGMKDLGTKRLRNKSGVNVNGDKDMEVEYVGRITRSRRRSRLSDESVSAEIIFVDDTSNCESELFSGSDSSPPSRTSGRKRHNRSNAGLNYKGRNNGSNKDVVRFCDLSNGSGVMVHKSCRETGDSSSVDDPADIIVLDQRVPLADGFYDDETISGSPKRRRLEALSVQSKWASSERVQLISKQLLCESVAEATTVVGKSCQEGSMLLSLENIIPGIKGVESGSSDSNVKILLRSVDSGLCGSQAVKRKTEADALLRISPVENGDSFKSEENVSREEDAKNFSSLSGVSVGISSTSSSVPQASCAVAGSDMMFNGSIPSSSEEFTAVDPSQQTCGYFNEECVAEALCPSGAPTPVEPASSFEVSSSVSETADRADSVSHELVPSQPHEEIPSGENSGAVESSVMTAVADYDSVLEGQANIVEVPTEHTYTLVSAQTQLDWMNNTGDVVVESPTISERNAGEEEMTGEQQVTSMVIPLDPSAAEVNDSEVELTLGASVEVSDEIEENVVPPKMIIDEEWIQAMECSRIEVKPVGLVRRSHAHELIVEPKSSSICPEQHITGVEGQSENNTESMIFSDVPLIVPVNTDSVLQRPSAASASAPPGIRTGSDDEGTVTAVVVGTSKNCRRIYDRTVHKEFSCPRCQKSYMLLHPFKVHLLKCCPHNLPTDLPLTRQELRTKQLMFSPENIAKAIGGISAKSPSDPTKSRSCSKSSDVVAVPTKRLKMMEKSPRKSPHYHSTDSNASSCSNVAASMPPSNFLGSPAVLPTTNSEIAGPVASTNKQKGIDENSTASGNESELEETPKRMSVPNGDLNSNKSGNNCKADHYDKQIMSPPTAKPCISERQARIKLFGVYMGQRPKLGPVEFPSEYPDETPEENLAYVLFTVEMEPGGMFYKDRRQMAMKLLNARAKKPASNPSIKSLQYSSEMPPPPPPSLPTSQWRFNVAHTVPRPFIRAGLSRCKPYYESRGFKPMLQRSETKAQLEKSRFGPENETAVAQVGRCKPLFESGRHLRFSYVPCIPSRLP